MKIVRLHTGDDAQSHFEDLGLDALPAIVGSPSGGPSRLSRNPPTLFTDFHNAPGRQYVVVLSGVMELEVSDGSKRALLPGDMLLAEDLTGKGHISRGGGDDPRILLVVPLAS